MSNHGIHSQSGILDKIAKLLKLAANQGATAGEAAAAAAVAQDLMDRHKITEAMLSNDGEQDGADWFADEPLYEGGKLVLWRTRLAGGIARTNDCRVLLGHDFVDGGTKARARITLVGRKSDAEVVRYLYVYLARQIERLAQEYRGRAQVTGAKNVRVLCNNFRLGAVDEVVERLKERKRQTQVEFAAETVALVRLDERDRQAELAAGEHAQGHYKPAPVVYSKAARLAGHEAGKEIQLQEAIES